MTVWSPTHIQNRAMKQLKQRSASHADHYLTLNKILLVFYRAKVDQTHKVHIWTHCSNLWVLLLTSYYHIRTKALIRMRLLIGIGGQAKSNHYGILDISGKNSDIHV